MFTVIQDYFEKYPHEFELLFPKLEFIKELQDPFIRSALPGHITASGIVIEQQQILLIKHRYIGEWFQPGGHVDPEEMPLEAAIREVHEETGWLTELRGINLPIDIDVHLIPANPIKNEAEHWHVDFAYHLKAITKETALDPEDTQWFDIHTIQATRLVRAIKKSLAI
jgi:8-oxo-dGTP pyrophosphatase MutT (NUDIX family)